MVDSLGDRIKSYENVYRKHLIKRMPVMVRVDGKSFHTFTKDFEKPFDRNIISAMSLAAKRVASDMQGFKAAYIQSDEATFLITDYDDINTEGWFNYNHDKIVSISASLISVSFNDILACLTNTFGRSLALFDSRAFNVPREDVVNAFLWRCQDWKRNSLQMYARSIFSHKELHNKNQSDMYEMLHQKGKNWATDLTDVQKNGTFLIKTEDGIESKYDIFPSYSDIAKVIDPLIYPLMKVE